MPETQDFEAVFKWRRGGHLVWLSDVPEGSPVFHGTDVPVQYLFDYVDQMYNLYAFLEDHPVISAEQALEGIREYVRADIPAHSKRGMVSGTPVFRGTRVPLHFLFGHMADSVNVDEFLLSYPSVERQQAIRAIQPGGLLLEAMVYECALTEAGDSPHPQGDNHRGDRRSSRRESVTTQLHEAAWLGRAETVQALISAIGADPNSYSIRRYGGTALHKAARQGHADTVRALLSASADPNLPSTHLYGGTSLHSAAWSGDPETIRALIAGGAAPNATDEYGRTPAGRASMRGEHQMAEMIAQADGPLQQDERRADPSETDRDQLTRDAKADATERQRHADSLEVTLRRVSKDMGPRKWRREDM